MVKTWTKTKKLIENDEAEDDEREQSQGLSSGARRLCVVRGDEVSGGESKARQERRVECESLMRRGEREKGKGREVRGRK